MAAAVEVSVVLPAYNEAETIEGTVLATLEALEGFLPPGSYEVIVAEDGCDDATPEIADRLAAEHEAVRHLHSDERRGRGGALEYAFERAAGDTLVYFDTDLATDLGHLEELVESVRSGEYDVATGSRWLPDSAADRPAKRGVPSLGFNALVRTFLRSDLQDHQCGFKAFDRAALEDLLPAVEDDHWFWDTEVLVRAQRAGYRVKEFPVDWTPKGDSKVDLVRDVFGMGSQILRTWWQFSVSPRLNRRISFVAGALLVAVAVGLMTLYLDPTAVFSAVAAADPALLALAGTVYLLIWPLRGLRYRYVLDRLGFHERWRFLVGIIFISQTGNLVFPARAGDGVRAYVLKLRRSIPYTAGFASLVIERLFDLLVIAGVAASALAVLVFSGQADVLAQGIVDAGTVGATAAARTGFAVAAGVTVVTVVVLVAVLATARSDRRYGRTVLATLSDAEYVEPVASVMERFTGAVQAVTTAPRAALVLAVASLAVWAVDVATAVVVAVALGVEVPLATLAVATLIAVTLGNLTKVVPVSPDNVGLYEGVATAVLVGLTPVSASLALTVAVLDHALKNLVTVVGGIAAIAWLNVSLTRVASESGDVGPASGD